MLVYTCAGNCCAVQLGQLLRSATYGTQHRKQLLGRSSNLILVWVSRPATSALHLPVLSVTEPAAARALGRHFILVSIGVSVSAGVPPLHVPVRVVPLLVHQRMLLETAVLLVGVLFIARIAVSALCLLLCRRPCRRWSSSGRCDGAVDAPSLAAVLYPTSADIRSATRGLVSRAPFVSADSRKVCAVSRHARRGFTANHWHGVVPCRACADNVQLWASGVTCTVLTPPALLGCISGVTLPTHAPARSAAVAVRLCARVRCCHGCFVLYRCSYLCARVALLRRRCMSGCTAGGGLQSLTPQFRASLQAVPLYLARRLCVCLRPAVVRSTSHCVATASVCAGVVRRWWRTTRHRGHTGARGNREPTSSGVC